MLAQLALPFIPVRRACAAPVIEAASNDAARAWLARTAAWPQRRLALWGPAGCGKSRLLDHWATREGARLVAGPALRFEPPSRGLAIDDADRAPPLALLHMLNAALEAGHPVLLAAPVPPARWGNQQHGMANLPDFANLPDLTSRLRAITAVAIEAPEDEMLRALLARLLAERQLRPAEVTLAWLLARLPRTHAAIAEAVERLDRAGQAMGAAISPALARQVLPDLLADLPDASEPSPGDPPADDDDFASLLLAPSPVPGGLL